MKKHLCFLAVLVFALNAGYTQIAVKGRVVDLFTNQPVTGASVLIVKNQAGTVTDINGNFTLPAVSGDDSIRLSSIGYTSKTMKATATQKFVSLTPISTNLDEVVVSGNREIQRRTEIPAAVNVISKSVINDTKATRLDMLINKVPGVYMVDLGNEQHSMSVRQPIGTKNLFLYLEDGIPVRTVGDFNHNALIEINQASLERIEVIKGPASSLYGSEAVGGAINFITQAPSPFFTGKMQAEIGSRGYRRTDFNVSNTFKKLGIFTGGYYTRQSQPSEEHNDFAKTALTLRADYRFNDKIRLISTADYIAYKTDQKGGLDSAHFYNKDYISFYRFTYRKVDAFRLKTTLSKEWSADNHSTFTVFYRHSVIGQNPFYSIANIANNASKAKGQINEDGFKSIGAVLQHTTKFNAINAKLVSGISIDNSPASYNAKFIDIDRDSNKVYYQYTLRDSLLTSYNVRLLNSAAYTQFEYKPVEKLKLVAAARFDRLDYQFDNHLKPGAFTGAPDATDHFAHFTPKVGLTYNIGKNQVVYSNYSVGFAPPNISDLYTGVQVPVLKAASYNNYEIGGWVSFAGNKGSAEISLYSLQGENEIVSVRLADGSYQNQNTGKTSHNGAEVNLKCAPVEDVAVRLAGSFAEHKYVSYIEQGKDYSGHKMAQAPPCIYNGEITFKPRLIKGFRIGAEVQGMNAYFTNPQNTATYNGFTVFNVRAGYALQCFEMWANCLNVTDQTFATTVEKTAFGTSYRPGQLRTVNIGFAYNIKSKK